MAIPRPEIVPVLRAHERVLAATPVPVGAKHRIAAALRERAEHRRHAAGPPRLLPMLTFVAGAALVMIVAGYNVLRSPAAPTQGVPTLAGYAVHGSDCVGQLHGTVTRLSGVCRLVGPSMSVQTWGEVRLVSGPTTVELLAGEARFDVAKVAAGEPSVRVVVSHGIIEVLGTRFTVEQDEGGGAVELHEGHIRYVPLALPGAVVDVQPGQRHAWGDRAAARPVPAEAEVAPASDPVPEAAGPRPRRRPLGTEADASAIIDAVTALRAEGRYRVAAGMLRRALKRRWRTRTAQVLSYELGSILEHHLGDSAAACRHWSRHQARHPAGRYAVAVAASLRSCPP